MVFTLANVMYIILIYIILGQMVGFLLFKT